MRTGETAGRRHCFYSVYGKAANGEWHVITLLRKLACHHSPSTFSFALLALLVGSDTPLATCCSITGWVHGHTAHFQHYPSPVKLWKDSVGDTDTLLLLRCLLSSGAGWHIRDKLRPVREHGSALLYAHGNHKARSDGKPRRATSTLTQLLDSDTDAHSLIHFESGIWEVRRLVPFSSSFSPCFRSFYNLSRKPHLGINRITGRTPVLWRCRKLRNVEGWRLMKGEAEKRVLGSE